VTSRGQTPRATERPKQFLSSQDNPAYEKGRALIRKIAEEYPFCSVISTADLFLKKDRIFVIDGKDCLYIDDDHLSIKGALIAYERILDPLLNYVQKGNDIDIAKKNDTTHIGGI
jgi:hypothetical protein